MAEGKTKSNRAEVLAILFFATGFTKGRGAQIGMDAAMAEPPTTYNNRVTARMMVGR